MLKRDYPDRNTGQGPAAKRLDSSGTPGRLVACLNVFLVYLMYNSEL